MATAHNFAIFLESHSSAQLARRIIRLAARKGCKDIFATYCICGVDQGWSMVTVPEIYDDLER